MLAQIFRSISFLRERTVMSKDSCQRQRRAPEARLCKLKLVSAWVRAELVSAWVQDELISWDCRSMQQLWQKKRARSFLTTER